MLAENTRNFIGFQTGHEEIPRVGIAQEESIEQQCEQQVCIWIHVYVREKAVAAVSIILHILTGFRGVMQVIPWTS